MNLIQVQIKISKFTFYAVLSEKNLHRLGWQNVPELKLSKKNIDLKFERLVEKLKTELEEYILGNKKVFLIPFSLEGTDFQMKVWKEIQQINYGEVKTYSQIAEAIGYSKAVRAVGTAIGKNPLCLILPCHRVVTKSNGLGEYVGGRKLKEKLLNLEKSLEEVH